MQQIIRAATIQPHAKIRVERLLPRPGEVNVSVGQEISPAQTIARAPGDVVFHVIAASAQLGVSPTEAEDFLEVEIGDHVEPGAVLLRKKRLLRSDVVESPVEGRVYAFRNGRFVLRQVRHVHEMRALLEGRVVNYIAHRGVILETQGSLIQAPWSCGDDAYGPLKIMVNTPHEPLTVEALADDTADQILVAGIIAQADVLQQASLSDVRGIIVGSMPADVYETVRELSLTVVLTEGVGHMPMSQPVWQSLREWEGHAASLFAPTARGKPAEIVIPHSSKPGQAQPPLYHPMTEGETVRILRGPFASRVGKVVKLYEQAQATVISGKAHGADVRLADEQVIFVPYANMQLIL